MADHARQTCVREPNADAACGASLTRIMVSVAIVALVVRAAWGIYRLAHGVALEFPDEQQYWMMAESVRAGHGLVDELGFRAGRMPLYPAMLSLFVGLGPGVYAATVWHWALGAAAAGLAAGLADAMFGRHAAWCAGLLVAFDPFLIFFSSLLLTETLFSCATLGLWWAAWPLADPAKVISWKRWALVGLLSALSLYARETGLVFTAVLLLFLNVRRRFRAEALGGSLIVGVIVLAALVPWGLRNSYTIGHFSLLTQRGGISLYDGVGPQATGQSDLGDIKQKPAVAGLNEVEWNRYFLRQSIECMRDDPLRIVELAGVKMKRMWSLIPNADTYRGPLVRGVAAAWCIPTFALALCGMLLGLRSGAACTRAAVWMLLLPAFTLSVLHCFFVGSVRYRLGAVPMLHVLAAFALAELVRRYRAHRLELARSP